MEKIKVTGCCDCPACQPNDMAGGFSCNLREYPENYINEDRFMSPVTPKWCPLKTSPILLVNDNTTHFDSNSAPSDSFDQILREEFLINSQNFPEEYHELFWKKYKRAEERFKNQ